MKRVFLTKDVPRIGLAHEIISVSDGFAQNFILPRKLGVLLTADDEKAFAKREKIKEVKTKVIEESTSRLAEQIKILDLTLECKMHHDGKLYGSVKAEEIAELLKKHHVNVAKNQIDVEKIKTKGTYKVRIRLSSRLQPELTLHVVAK